MKPGRELDALIAEKVMNWPPIMHPLSKPVPHYSTDLAAAFAVDKPGWLWEFQETSQTLTVTLYKSFKVMQRAIRDFPVLPEDVILIRREWLDGKAATYAWLRCLAALEAVGVEIIHVPEDESITLGNRAVLENVVVVGVEVEDA